MPPKHQTDFQKQAAREAQARRWSRAAYADLQRINDYCAEHGLDTMTLDVIVAALGGRITTKRMLRLARAIEAARRADAV